jgi:tetratricopeptide (TPR) repeat protein
MLQLSPLPGGDIRRLVATRLGAEVLPEAFLRLVVEKAEGNALFAEEIVTYLTEQGVLRANGGQVEFDAGTVVAAMPASIQSLLTARVDQLALQDRALLQTASVIGRRFVPELLATVAGDGGDVFARLAAMQAIDLVYPEPRSSEYGFKHALVRDALYRSLLTGPRTALHLKVAEEIERRSGNRLTEVAETLAYHYSQTQRDDKAFAYLAMAAAKSLGVYSLEEASSHCAAAIALLDKNPDCANDEQVADLLVDYSLCSNMLIRMKHLTETVERFLHRLDRLGDSHQRVVIHHHYILALWLRKRYREARAAQADLLALANRLGDERSMAYALVSEIHTSTITAPKTTEDFEGICHQAVAAASAVNDPYIQMFVRFAIGWEEFHRGRMDKAHLAAEELMAVGRRIGDPRSIGMGLALKAWVALTSDDYAGALETAEAGIAIARTPQDEEAAKNAKNCALVLLRRPGALQMLQSYMDKCISNDLLGYLNGAEGIWGVALVLNGQISAGIRWLEQAILAGERDGYLAVADWYRIFLCEIYLEIISGTEKPSATVIARNILSIAAVTLTAEKRICALVEKARQNPQIDPNGHHIGRSEMILGLLYKAKKKRVLATQHLTEAKRIASQYGRTPMLAKIEAALAAL